MSEPQSNPSFARRLALLAGLVFDWVLIILVLVGVGFRFSWRNWNQGTALHPDEYGLTNTLTQLSIPKTLGEYFNTRLSPISPYQRYDLAGQPGQDGPDNRMRWGQWPIIIYRAAGEWTGQTGYDEIRLLGRWISALADTFSLLFIFLIGRRLYNRRVGLLAAALSALAVMQIQQSHFMTADSLAGLFTILAMYCAVRIAQGTSLYRPAGNPDKPAGRGYQPARRAWLWYVLFGVTFGMALASRINLAPLAGMVLIAAFISIAGLTLRSKMDLRRIAVVALGYLVLSGLLAGLTFRLVQPMSFRVTSGDTSFFTLQLNPDWVESMKVAQNESNGIGGGPPGEQWAGRLPLVFPLVNMVMWGMGLPLGCMAWLGFAWAAWQTFRYGKSWRAHLLPLVWVGGYFLFMGTRWVKSVRYFLPIYPFLCLLAAWALLELWSRRSALPHPQQDSVEAVRAVSQPRRLGWLLPALVCGVVILGTLAWAWGFVRAVYMQDHTRIQASKWIYQNIPAPFNLAVDTAAGTQNVLVPAPDNLLVVPDHPVIQPFTLETGGKLEGVSIPHLTLAPYSQGTASLKVVVSSDPLGQNSLDEVDFQFDPPVGVTGGSSIQANFHGAALEKNTTYFLVVSAASSEVTITRSVVSNENWDEGLPLMIQGRNPFGDLYRGLTMEVRWYDDENKRQMFLQNLAQVDYIILPSQRAIWSAPRLPLTYPMTLEYYRALFDGRLGFDLVAEFDSPFQFGPLSISDVGGTFAWGSKAKLPLFNNNLLAAEEAFSVYDHPPVWIFKKRADFDLERAYQLLGSFDLSQVVVQSPRESIPLKTEP
jgi:Dolichyl-phosphate-mannose-protein mannosyltransferase